MIRVGIIGTGGFAAMHHRAIQALEQAGECRLVCTCDPDPVRLETAYTSWEGAQRGVQTYSHYIEMLDRHAHELDIVTVPTPIPLHAEMHRACVDHGIACYLEKPPTLDPSELETMIATDQRAKKETQVAFNFIVETTRQALKTRLLAGEFGTLRQVTFLGHWPRTTSYFERNNWAGSLIGPDGHLILDSCLGNAMAHYAHNLFFWADTSSLHSYAELATVEAELYRARPIATFDTGFIRAICDNGVELRFVGTHACAGRHYHEEHLTCDGATIRYVTGGDYEITYLADGRTESAQADPRNLLEENFRDYFAYVAGQTTRPLIRLTDARSFVAFNGLAYVAASSIATVQDEYVERITDTNNPSVTTAYTIDEIQAVAERFVSTGAFPSEQGVSWGRPGAGIAPLADLSRLPSLIHAL